MALQPVSPFLMAVFCIVQGTANRIAGICKADDRYRRLQRQK